MATFKARLRACQIYFTTIASVSLSIMAIIVSLAQCMVSRDQTRIAESAIRPQFDIGIRLVRNESSGFFEDSLLYVDNNGGPARGFSFESMVFIDVSAAAAQADLDKGRAGSGISGTNIRLPVLGFFSTSFVSPAAKGRMVDEIGSKNNKWFFDLSNALLKKSDDFPFQYVNVDISVYAKIEYRDILGVDTVEFYRVPLVGPARSLSESDGRLVEAAWSSNEKRDIASLTSEAVRTLALARLKSR